MVVPTDDKLLPRFSGEWKHRTLESLCCIINGTTPKTSVPDYWGGNINWCTPTDVTACKSKYLSTTEKKITKKGLIENGLTLLPKGTLLLCSRATIGEIRISVCEITINQGFKALIVNDDVSNEWLYYYLLTLKNKMVEKAIGSTFLELSRKETKKLDLLCPKIEEQIAIANILTHIDELIASLQKLIEKKRAVKQGAMQELLTGKKRLPRFNGGWYQTTISSVLSIGHGKSQKEIEDINGKYPILATSGEIGRTNEFIYDKPSVLIGRKGTIDKPQYMDKPFWTIDTLFYTIIKTDYSVKYLYYLFCIINWASYNEASGVPSLNSKIIENIDIIIPPSLSEQAAIADILTNMDDEIEQLEQKLHKYENIKIGMMQNLLTGKIRLPTT